MLLHLRRNVTLDTTHKGENNPSAKIHIGELKGKRGRKVALSSYVLSLLDELKAEQEEQYGVTLFPTMYVFCRAGAPELPIYPSEPTRLLRKFIKRHNLPNVSPHDLRHTSGYLAIESGASVKDIQELLGHRDPSLTLKFYIGVSEKAQQRTVAGIESLLRPSKMA